MIKIMMMMVIIVIVITMMMMIIIIIPTTSGNGNRDVNSTDNILRISANSIVSCCDQRPGGFGGILFILCCY